MVAAEGIAALAVIENRHQIAFVIGKIAPHERADIRLFVVALLGDTLLRVNFDALEVLLELEVHDTRDGVRSVS